MNKPLKYTLIVLGCLAAMFIWFLLWLKCNPIHIGGANGQVKPAYCSIGEKWQEKQRKKETMKTIEEIKKNLEFTCVHEKRPPLSEETQQLYNYALHRDLNHIWPGQRGTVFGMNYCPITALQPPTATIRQTYGCSFCSATAGRRFPILRLKLKFTSCIKCCTNNFQLPPTICLKAILKTATVSVPPDSELTFLRKAADMGSREAQYTLGQMISSLDDEETREFRLKLMMKLYRCASEQGQGNASYWLGMFLPDYHKYDEAVRAYYQGVKNGNYLSAFILFNAFKAGKDKGSNDFLDVETDEERARRYGIIDSYLSTYEFMSPTVPDLDDIVPLPPAPLPEWDGKIAFQRWVEGAEPPKPSDELLKKLADKAGVDVKTGLPLSE